VERNLTLATDDATLKAARKLAIDRSTSVNQMVREFLERFVAGDDPKRTALAAMDQFFASPGGAIGDGRWSRERIHEREGSGSRRR
jgi:hypothetical protein